MAVGDISGRVGWRLAQAVRGMDATEHPKEGTCEVVSRDGEGTVWVRLPGNDFDTPANGGTLASVSAGDSVRYRIEGGKLTIMGNGSDPSAGSSAVLVIERTANDAMDVATRAEGDALRAAIAADSAEQDAARANRYANGALAGLGTLESVIDTTNWFAEHRTASTDTTVVAGKDYYTYESGTLSRVDPDGTENPSQEGWWELDEAIANYVASHVATTDDGLYVVGLSNGWRVLVSSGAGDYDPGVFLIDPLGTIAQATTASGITFDETKPFSIGSEDAYIVFHDTDNDGTPDTITIGGRVVMGSGESLSELLAGVSYDHTFGETATTYDFRAYAYRGGIDVTDEFDPSSFGWWLRTEDGDEWLGSGVVMSVAKSRAGYRASVVGGITVAETAALVDVDGNGITDSVGDGISLLAVG